MAVGISVYEIASADEEDRAKTAAAEAGGLTGAVAGGEVFGTVGFLLGSFFPGPGNAVGAIVGGVGGALLFGHLGEQAGANIYDAARDEAVSQDN